MQVYLVNGLWLILPIIIWNGVMTGRLKHPVITEDSGTPRWAWISEHGLRILVFILPLFYRIDVSSDHGRAGLALYVLGTALYFSSWLPFLTPRVTAWNRSLPGVVAPYLLPFFIFTGMSLVFDSPFYFIVSLLFTVVHVAVGIRKYRHHQSA